jgi:Mg-chelatase subunit ChlD
MTKTPIKTDGPGAAWARKLEAASGKSVGERRKAMGVGTPSVILAVDCSGSMAGDKIRQAREGALDFGRDAINRGYAVGVVGFGSAAEMLAAPSQHEGSFSGALARLSVSGTTNMAAGIDAATTTLGTRGNRIVCVVTDGMPDSIGDAITSAQRARASGIEIMAVGTDDADWTFLSQIVSRRELATKIERREFGKQIASMSKMLPQLAHRKI